MLTEYHVVQPKINEINNFSVCKYVFLSQKFLCTHKKPGFIIIFNVHMRSQKVKTFLHLIPATMGEDHIVIQPVFLAADLSPTIYSDSCP